MASSLARPPAFRITWASPSARPAYLAGSRRASIQVRIAKWRLGGSGRLALSPKFPAYFAGSAPDIFSCYPTRLDNSEQEGRAVTKILDEVLSANGSTAGNFGDKGNLPLPPSRHFAILTCMDAR